MISLRSHRDENEMVFEHLPSTRLNQYTTLCYTLVSRLGYDSAVGQSNKFGGEGWDSGQFASAQMLKIMPSIIGAGFSWV
jgi:hypothetical protein